MDVREKQIIPPRSWIKFEDLCHALFKAVWGDPLAQKNGRSGQAQHGVDIFGTPDPSRAVFHGVQCKGKDQTYGEKPTLAELQREIAKADHFSPALQHWVFTTSAPVDSVLQEKARQISVARQAAGRFTVTTLGWGSIQSLLADHPSVLKEFYPEHAFDLPALIERLSELPSGNEVQELMRYVRKWAKEHSADSTVHRTVSGAIWQPVSFEGGRDLGPAILGRSLGPADAAACPRLEEADTIVSQLYRAYSVRLVGEPGAGKSICAYQVAADFARSGWSIVRLSDSGADRIQLETVDDTRRTLFVIDDAHLTPAHVLGAAEEQAGPNKFLLSTHNAVEHDSTYRGSISIDVKRAVRTIAAALRAEPNKTLEVVRRADDSVGERAFDEDIEGRISHAETVADRPWQFCFVLGGGWRRAKEAADNARVADADIALAGAAIHQIASRDARASRTQLRERLRVVVQDQEAVDTALDWLLSQRLLLAPDDLRCPHQRFSLAVLGQILEGQDSQGRESIGLMLQSAIGDNAYPLAGLWMLLHELRFSGPGHGRWVKLLPHRTLQRLIERCWQATEPQERTFAALIFSDLERYIPGWPRSVLEDRIPQLVQWISEPVEPSGYGVGRLMNNVRNEDKDFARAIVTASDPGTVAAGVSAITPATTYNLAEFLAGIGYHPADAWATTFNQELNQSTFLKLAATWPSSEPVFVFSKLCQAMMWWSDDLAVDMVEHFLPVAATTLAENPLSGFRDLDDIASTVLRVFDVLGVYVGRHRPGTRRLLLAKQMCAKLKPKKLAAQLSASRKRDFQRMAFLLSFLRRAAPAKYYATVAALDWKQLEQEIGEDWRNLPHEAEILIGAAFSKNEAGAVIVEMVNRNLDRIVNFPPRLVIMAPQAAFSHVERGLSIRLSQHDQLDWRFGAAVVAIFREERPDLLEGILATSEKVAGRALSQKHPSWYGEAAEFINIINQAAPTSVQRILDAVDIVEAEEGWAVCLAKSGPARQTVALLVESAIGRHDEVGLMANRLRKKYPKASVPKNSDRANTHE